MLLDLHVYRAGAHQMTGNSLRCFFFSTKKFLVVSYMSRFELDEAASQILGIDIGNEVIWRILIIHITTETV